MSPISSDTLLSPNTWAEVLGISPWEFNQFVVQKATSCDKVFFQYAWQRDFLTRDEVYRAIADAEQMVSSQLDYFPAPKQVLAEPYRYPWPSAAAGGWGHTQYTEEGQLKTIQLRRGEFIQGGTYASSVIAIDLPVTLTDADGDGYTDTFTITSPTTVTDPSELHVYFDYASRFGEDISKGWEIRPIEVKISLGIATIKGKAPYIKLPSKSLGVAPSPLDPAVAGNYTTKLDLYRVYVDTTSTDAQAQQGLAFWKDYAYFCYPNCDDIAHAVCLGPSLPKEGTIYLAFDSSIICPAGLPERLELNYISGYPPDAQGNMNLLMAQIVTRLSVTLLPNLACGCERSSRIISYWRQAPPIGRLVTEAELLVDPECPFGQYRGAQWAWARIKELRQYRGISIR